jgi:hypothetical protein
MLCQESNCPDYLTDEGEPAWCFWAGMPAQAAVQKCPKIEIEKSKGSNEKRTWENKHEEQA